MFTTQFYQDLATTHQYDLIAARHIDFAMPGVGRMDLQRRWLCHDGGDQFATHAAQEPQACVIATGIGLSGPPHAGTLSQIARAIFLQQAGYRVQFVLGDLDAYNGKNLDLADVREIADRYRRFICALGFDQERGMLRDQFDALQVLRTMYLAGRHMSDQDFLEAEEDMHAFYAERGKADPKMTFRRKLSLALMTADFLDLGRQGYHRVLVTLGVDEHRYVRFAKGVAARTAAHLPDYRVDISALYSPLILGLNGYPKMSKSFPQSGIHLDMSANDIQRCIVEDADPAEDHSESPLVQMLQAVSGITLPELDQAIAARQRSATEWQSWRERLADEITSMQRIWKGTTNVCRRQSGR